MSDRAQNLAISSLQWIKMQVRLAALEQGGRRLLHRFEFPDDTSIICDVYFADDESNSLENASPVERIEIYEGWINLGKDILRRALEKAELPTAFTWKPRLEFVLHVNRGGMGSSVVHKCESEFRWPTEF